jgi:hypothetical protein
MRLLELLKLKVKLALVALATSVVILCTSDVNIDEVIYKHKEE